MNGHAKNAYDAYHAEMNTMADAPPFERLSDREQHAWMEVAAVTEGLLWRLESAYQELHQAERRCADLEEESFDLKQKIEALEDELKAAKEGQPK